MYVLHNISSTELFLDSGFVCPWANQAWMEPSPCPWQPPSESGWSSSGHQQSPASCPTSLILYPDLLWPPRTLAAWLSGLKLFRNVKSRFLKANCMQCLILLIENYKSKCTGLEIRWPHFLSSQSGSHVPGLPTCVLDYQEVLASHDLGLFKSKFKGLYLD